MGKKISVTELAWYERFTLGFLAVIMRLWWLTLRFHWGPKVQAIIDEPPSTCVIILWHNRLFAAPEFFRRNFARRRLATLISASSDGAWLAALLCKLGMFPIRGSHYKRGSQAVREMLAAHQEGYDLAITPDGSRGPIYDLKPGAVAVALKTGAPLVMLSLNFSRAWRLNSWDRFFVPTPFSRIEVCLDLVKDLSVLGSDPKELAHLLKVRLDAMSTSH